MPLQGEVSECIAIARDVCVLTFGLPCAFSLVWHNLHHFAVRRVAVSVQDLRRGWHLGARGPAIGRWWRLFVVLAHSEVQTLWQEPNVRSLARRPACLL